MLAVKEEYVAECRRLRLEPYAGFLRQLSSSVLDTDLDGVPVVNIRLFAAALCHVGLRVARVPAAAAHVTRTATTTNTTNSRAVDGHTKLAVRKTTGTTTTTTTKRGATTLAGLVSSTTSGGKTRAEKEVRLVKLCLRHGLRPHGSSLYASYAHAEGGTTHVAAPGAASHVQLSAQSAFSVIPRAARSGPSRTTSARSDAAHDLTHASQRAVLQSLLAGLRQVIWYSQSCLTVVQLSGLPLQEVGSHVAVRLMQALARCPHLRVLDLSRSQLGNELFLQLTTHTHHGTGDALCSLREARFAECGLSEGCARGVASLLLASGAHVSAVRWSTSLRQEGRRDARKKTREEGTAAPQTPREDGLCHVDLSGNDLGEAALRALVHGLEGNRTLRSIDLSRNRLSLNAVLELIKSGVLQTCALQSLDLSRNNTTGSGGDDDDDKYAVEAVRVALGGAPFRCVHAAPQQLLLTRAPATSSARREQPLAAKRSNDNVGAEKAEETANHAVPPEAQAVGMTATATTARVPEAPETVGQDALPAQLPTYSCSSRNNNSNNTNTAPPPPPTASPIPMSLLPVTQNTLTNDHVSACRVLYVPALWVPGNDVMMGSEAVMAPHTTHYNSTKTCVQTSVAAAAATQTRCDRATSPTAPTHDASVPATIEMTTEGHNKEEKEEEEDAERQEQRMSRWDEQKFLAALVARVEGNENELTDRLEQHVQRTREELTRLRAELQGWCTESSEAQREALAALTAQHESTMRALIEEVEQRRRATPELDMRAQLAQLIEQGMDTVRAQVQAMHGLTPQPRTSSPSRAVRPLREAGATAAAGGSDGGQQTAFLRAAHTRLAALGW